ncbi:MAG: hypothetical protein K9N10_20140 [Deltaproteobacteria bacterium]|nr:hypothetical protein [Deltaproteobacteria bacterium]
MAITILRRKYLSNVFTQLGIVDGGKWLDQEVGNNWKADLDSNFVWAIGAKGKIKEPL